MREGIMQVGTALSILAQPGRPDVALFNEHMALGDLAEPLGFDISTGPVVLKAPIF